MFDRRSWVRGLLVVVAIALAAGYALGAQQSTNLDQPSTRSSERMSQMPGQSSEALTLARTDKLIGKDLKDAQGQTVGKAEDIVLNPSLRRVSYIALNADGKYYAVPWSALHKGAGDTYTLSISKTDLSKAQAFDKDRWPSDADTQLLSLSQAGMASSQMGSRYGQQETSSSQQGVGSSSQQGAGASQQGIAQSSSLRGSDVDQRRVSKINGTDVKDSQGDSIGSIKGFVIDLGGVNSGQISSQTSGTMGSLGSTGAGSQTGSTTGGSGTASTAGSAGSAGSSQTGSNAGYGSGSMSGQSASSGQSGMGTAMGRQLRSGQLVFTILSTSGGKWSLVPSNIVNIQPGQRAATANATKQTIDSLAFSPDNFPNLSSRQYVRQVYQTFGQQAYGSALGYVPPGQSSESGRMNQQGQMGETGRTDQSGQFDQTGQTGTGQTDQDRSGAGSTSNQYQ